MLAVLLLVLVQDSASHSTQMEISELIDGLGSEDIKCRAAASLKLMELGETAHSQLRSALSCADIEVQARCRELLRGSQFHPGARVLAGVCDDSNEINIDPAMWKDYQALATGGKVFTIAGEDYRWMPYVIEGLLSDEREVLKSSLHSLHLIICRRAISDVSSDLVGRVDFGSFESAQSRAEEFLYWREWWCAATNKGISSQWETMKPTAANEDWARTLTEIRGGEFDNPSTTAFHHLERIQSLGEEAIPSIVQYLDADDVTIGRSALGLLRKLTGRTERALTEENKYDIRAEWLAWLKSDR